MMHYFVLAKSMLAGVGDAVSFLVVAENTEEAWSRAEERLRRNTSHSHVKFVITKFTRAD